MILIINNNKIVGADIDFLNNYSLEDLNKQININDLTTKNQIEFENKLYDILPIIVKNNTFIVFNIFSNGETENNPQNKKEELDITNLDMFNEINSEINNKNSESPSNIILNEQSENNEPKKEETITESNSDFSLGLDNLLAEEETPSLQPEQPKHNDEKKENNDILSSDLGLDLDSLVSDKPKNKEKEINLLEKIDPKNFLNKNPEEVKNILEKEIESSIENLGIDKEIMDSLFQEFIEQIKNEKKFFYNEIENQDYTNLHKSSHKLKGVLLNLGLNQLGEVFSNLDKAIQEKEDINQIKVVIDKIYQSLSALLNEEPISKIDNSTSEKQLNLDYLNMSEADLKLRLKILSNIIEEIKNSNKNIIISKLENIYNNFQLKELKEIIELNNETEIKDKLSSLESVIQKELK